MRLPITDVLNEHTRARTFFESSVFENDGNASEQQRLKEEAILFVNDCEIRTNIVAEESFKFLNHLCKKVEDLTPQEKDSMELRLKDLDTIPELKERVRNIEQSWRKFKNQGVEFRLEGSDVFQTHNNDNLIVVSSSYVTGRARFDRTIDLHDAFEDSNPIVILDEERLNCSPGMTGFLSDCTSDDMEIGVCSQVADTPTKDYYIYCNQVIKKVAQLQPKIVIDSLKEVDRLAEETAIPRCLDFLRIKKEPFDTPFFLVEPEIKAELIREKRIDVDSMIQDGICSDIFKFISEYSSGLLEGPWTLPLISVLPEILISTQLTQDDVSALTLRALNLVASKVVGSHLPAGAVWTIFRHLLDTKNRTLLTDGPLMEVLPAHVRRDIKETFEASGGITFENVDLANMVTLHNEWTS